MGGRIEKMTYKDNPHNKVTLSRGFSIYPTPNRSDTVKGIGYKKMNKKGDTVSIVLLTALTLILVSVTIYYFIVSEKERTNILNIPVGIDSVYTKEAYLNFYLEASFDRASKDFAYSYGKSKFIEKFKAELENYKDENGEYFIAGLDSVRNSVNESNVELTKTLLKLSIPIVIEGNFQDQGLEVKYSYEKVFEKALVS